MEREPHDGAQSQAESVRDTRTPDTDATDRPVPAPQPVIAAPGKPDGEVDTRR